MPLFSVIFINSTLHSSISSKNIPSENYQSLMRKQTQFHTTQERPHYSGTSKTQLPQSLHCKHLLHAWTHLEGLGEGAQELKLSCTSSGSFHFDHCTFQLTLSKHEFFSFFSLGVSLHQVTWKHIIIPLERRSPQAHKSW